MKLFLMHMYKMFLKIFLKIWEKVKDKGKSFLWNDFYTYLVENDTLTYSDVIASSYAYFWKEAIKTEIDSITHNNIWILVDLPLEAKPISGKWVFKKKYNPDGSIDKYKARLAIKGFAKKEDVDYLMLLLLWPGFLLFEFYLLWHQ